MRLYTKTQKKQFDSKCLKFFFSIAAILLLMSCANKKKENAESCRNEDKVLVESYKEGQTDAKRDLENKILRLKHWGSPVTSWYEKRLKGKYGIEFKVVSGYFISNKINEYIKGYNDVMGKVIKDKYGDDFFQNVQKEAYQLYLNQQKKQAREQYEF